MQKADTEYLAREIASLRIALGDVATRDFLRGELNRLVEELGETIAELDARRSTTGTAGTGSTSGPMPGTTDKTRMPKSVRKEQRRMARRTNP
jgi:hypothetical protein